MSTRKKRAYSQKVASIAGQEISNKGYVSLGCLKTPNSHSHVLD